MPLADHANKPAAPVLCRLGEIRARLDATEQAALDILLADPQRWPARKLTAILRSESHVVGRTVVQEHRVGVCRCRSLST